MQKLHKTNRSFSSYRIRTSFSLQLQTEPMSLVPTPQPTFNKQFDLLASDLIKRIDE